MKTKTKNPFVTNLAPEVTFLQEYMVHIAFRDYTRLLKH